MAIVIEDIQMERLAEQIAVAEGVSASAMKAMIRISPPQPGQTSGKTA